MQKTHAENSCVNAPLIQLAKYSVIRGHSNNTWHIFGLFLSLLPNVSCGDTGTDPLSPAWRYIFFSYNRNFDISVIAITGFNFCVKKWPENTKEEYVV